MRRLSAIMFTDMVGYTALMQEDENRATEVRDRHRRVLREAIEAQGGEIIQFYGDGTLSVFPSAVNSVAAAIDIQQRLRKPPEIPVRIGLHVGDIIHDEDGIHGDGVNVAARVQGLAVPGAVLLSGRVADEVRNHPEFPVRELGAYELKNVKVPMPVSTLVVDGVVVPTAHELASSHAPLKKSIAVLPFVSMSSDVEDEYFADGVTEEILNTLARFEGLNVTARTSSFAFKGRNEDVREIGKSLSVDFVLEGSVRRAGNRVRITAQMISTADGYHLFSNTYDRVLDDIFATQDEISVTIAEELRVLLPTVPKAERPRARKPTENAEAYAEYLRGLHCWNQWTPHTTQEALGHFEAAVELDADFALAHTGVARGYVHLGSVGNIHPRTAFPLAKKAALRAIELDPRMGESHMALGLVKLFYDWDLPGAKASCLRAVELSPGSAEIYHLFSLYYMASGEADLGLEVCERAEALDPLSPLMVNSLGRALSFAKRYEEALEMLNRALELDPNFRTAQEGKAWVYAETGEMERAVEEFERYRAMIPDGAGGYGPGVGVYAAAGRMVEAEEYLAKLEALEKSRPELTLHLDFSLALAALGRKDEALARVERAIEDRLGAVVFMRHAFMANSLINDPGLDRILKSIGL